MKIPKNWLHMHEGDRIHTVMPYHRIMAAFWALEPDGYRFRADPSNRGYWVVCLASPNVSPHKPDIGVTLQ